MDSQMLFGCTGFVFHSFLSYFLAIWPFLVWMEVHLLGRLSLLLLAAYVPAFAQGAIATIKFELAGAAGFVGGILASSIFLYLRFQQAFLEAEAQRTPWPDYPQALQWLVPGLIVMASLVQSGLLLLHQNPVSQTRQKS